MKTLLFGGLVLLALCLQVGAASKPKPLLSPTHQRIVFLGDSITDGNTYPAWIKQALVAAGYEAPICINAGYGGHTSTDMLNNLERNVIALHPTLVCISCGANDVLHGGGAFTTSYPAIIERLAKEKIPMVLMTLCVLGEMRKDKTDTTVPYNKLVHEMGEKYKLPVAEVNALQLEAWAQGIQVLEVDHVHPNLAGQRLIAQAVLTAMGYTDVVVPQTFKSELIPGLIKTWQMRAVTDPKEQPLDRENVKTIKPDAAWKTVTFPAKEPLKGQWEETERLCGFSMGQPANLEKGRYYLGYTELDEKTAHMAYINLGGYVRSVWLNGEKLYTVDTSIVWPGWHMGKFRLVGEFKAGKNVLIIETDPIFAVSVTENSNW